MYSLDQVIYFLEQRQQTEDWNIRGVAIEYLKAYRDDRDELTALRAFWKEQQENDPLTWDDLQQMNGKPVWVEVDGKWWGRFWAFVEVGSDSYINFFQKGQEYPEDLWKCNIGKTWQAYRKERS